MNIYNNSLQKHTMLFKQTQQNVLNTRSNDYGELLNSNAKFLAEKQRQNNILDKNKQNLEEEIEKNLAIFTGIYSTIKEIDSTGAFESDDEVGSVFGDLKSIIERNEKLLNSEFGKEEGE